MVVTYKHKEATIYIRLLCVGEGDKDMVYICVGTSMYNVTIQWNPLVARFGARQS